jgi:hypothetical protein
MSQAGEMNAETGEAMPFDALFAIAMRWIPQSPPTSPIASATGAALVFGEWPTRGGIAPTSGAIDPEMEGPVA